jgi:hypothetical protein
MDSVNLDYICTWLDPEHFHFRKSTKFGNKTALYFRRYTVSVQANATGKAIFYAFPKLLIGAGNATGNSGAYATGVADATVNTTTGVYTGASAAFL